MIRQAISCDICGAEKKQTNHWFVASEQAGELRVSGWSSRNRMRAATKHLCGQTCLHKLMDEFVARTLAARSTIAVAEPAPVAETRLETDASLTSKAAYVEPKFAASPMNKPAAVASVGPVLLSAPAILPIQSAPPADQARALPPPMEEVPNYASRRWRAEAWERERALHASERRNESGARHRRTQG